MEKAIIRKLKVSNNGILTFKIQTACKRLVEGITNTSIKLYLSKLEMPLDKTMINYEKLNSSA